MIQELSNFITPAENEYLQLVSDQFQIVKNAIVFHQFHLLVNRNTKMALTYYLWQLLDFKYNANNYRFLRKSGVQLFQT